MTPQSTRRLAMFLHTCVPRRMGWRLALGFGLVLSVMLAALALSSAQLQSMSTLAQRFANEDMRRLLKVQALSLYTEGQGNALLRLMNAPRAERVDEYANVDERNRRMDGLVATLSDEFDDPTQADNLRQLVAARTAYFDAFLATADEIEGDNAKAAMTVFTSQVQPALSTLLQASNALVNHERNRIEQQAAQAQAHHQQVVWGMLWFTAFAVALAAWLAWRTTRSVVVPLAQLENAAGRIAAGDYARAQVQTSAQEINRVGHALNAMTDAIAAREQEIERLAFRDPLTDLPNRTALLAPGRPGTQGHTTLMLLDLARLKAINATLGYATGDSLIQQAAQRIAHVVSDSTRDPRISATPAPCLSHLAGGLFAVSFCTAERAGAQALFERVQQAMALPAQCSGHSVDLSLYAGLADAPPNSPAGVAGLLRNAEVSLNAAKKSTQPMVWHNPAQEAARLSHLSLLSDLRQAVAQDQLQMWLQPKFSLQTGLPVGAEALVRWQHPQRGFVSPAEFIPFAEQTGYVGLITGWMLGQAVRTLAGWATSHPGLSIAVNISTHDLQSAGLSAQVQQLLTQHGVSPQRLRLEIVESGLMEDPTQSIAVLNSLRELGVHLSIDDFGTGYSSLAYLQTLPVSELKIDRSFVDRIDQRPATQRLFKTMVEMGHGLGLMVTAEGVETQAERHVITELGCDVMQGYLGSRPLHGAALQAWLNLNRVAHAGA